jgi:hypothetical protein
MSMRLKGRTWGSGLFSDHGNSRGIEDYEEEDGTTDGGGQGQGHGQRQEQKARVERDRDKDRTRNKVEAYAQACQQLGSFFLALTEVCERLVGAERCVVLLTQAGRTRGVPALPTRGVGGAAEPFFREEKTCDVSNPLLPGREAPFLWSILPGREDTVQFALDRSPHGTTSTESSIAECVLRATFVNQPKKDPSSHHEHGREGKGEGEGARARGRGVEDRGLRVPLSPSPPSSASSPSPSAHRTLDDHLSVELEMWFEQLLACPVLHMPLPPPAVSQREGAVSTTAPLETTTMPALGVLVAVNKVRHLPTTVGIGSGGGGGGGGSEGQHPHQRLRSSSNSSSSSSGSISSSTTTTTVAVGFVRDDEIMLRAIAEHLSLGLQRLRVRFFLEEPASTALSPPSPPPRDTVDDDNITDDDDCETNAPPHPPPPSSTTDDFANVLSCISMVRHLFSPLSLSEIAKLESRHLVDCWDWSLVLLGAPFASPSSALSHHHHPLSQATESNVPTVLTLSATRTLEDGETYDATVHLDTSGLRTTNGSDRFLWRVLQTAQSVLVEIVQSPRYVLFLYSLRLTDVTIFD